MDFGTSDPNTPVAGAPLSEVLRVISDRYDLNVEELEHFEWLIRSGLLPTVGPVFDAAEALNFPKKSPAFTGQGAVQDENAGSSPAARPTPLPQSWTQEPAFRSPEARPKRPEMFSLFTSPDGRPPILPIQEEQGFFVEEPLLPPASEPAQAPRKARTH